MPRLFRRHGVISGQRSAAQRGGMAHRDFAVQLIGERGGKQFPTCRAFPNRIVARQRRAHHFRLDVVAFLPLRPAIARGQLRADKENTRRKIVTLQPRHFPRRLAGGQLPVVIAFGLENETAAPRHLRHGCVRADAPDQGFQLVLARRKLDLISRVGPVLHVGAVGAACDAIAVKKQFAAFIRADMDARGRGAGLEPPAKADQNRLPPAAGEKVAMRRRGGISKIRMPNPGRLVNGLKLGDPGVSEMQARRQKDFMDDRRFVFRRGGGKRQGDGDHGETQCHRHFR